MELSQLRYFITLARCCNYSKASEEMFIAQPTLSQQIKKLEKELGVQLFERSTRKVELTAVGKECVLLAQKVLEDVDVLSQTAKEKSKIAMIAIGVLSIYPMRNVSDVLAQFQDDHPEVRLNLTFANSVQLVDMLQRRMLDAVIANISADGMEKDVLSKLQMDVFWDDKLYVLLSNQHPLAGRNTIAIEDILDETFLFASTSSSVQLRFHQALRAKGYALPKAQECPSISNMVNFIQANMGITLMSSHIAKAYVQADMKYIPIDPPLQTQTALIMRRTGQTLAMKIFFEYFHDHLERFPL